MRKNTFLKLFVLFTIVATLVGIIGITASAETKTQTLIDKNTQWSYLDTNSDPAAGLDNLQGWTDANYDDSAWKTGTGSFGAIYDSDTKDGIIGKVDFYTPQTLLKLILPNSSPMAAMPTYFFRTTFTVDDPDAYSHLIYTLNTNGGATVYLNGTVLTDTRSTTNDTTNLYYSAPTAKYSPYGYETKDLNLKEGENTLAVEVHAPKSTNAKFYFGITDMRLVYEDTDTIVAEQLMMNVGASESERNLAWFSGFEEGGEVRLVKASEVVNGAFPRENYASFPASSSKAVNIACRYAKSATISGLADATKYAYVIVGNGVMSEINYFETGAEGDSFSFVYVGDPQLGNKEAHAESWQDTIDKIISNFNPEFLLSGGDQVDNGANEAIYSDVFYQDEFTSLPFAPTMGPSHDAVSGFDIFATYGDHYNLPNQSDKYGVIQSGEYTITSNYWFTYNNTLFINLNMLDSEAVTNGEHRAFIEEAIASNPEAKWHIIVMHNSLYSTGMHGDPEYKHYDTEIGVYRPIMSEMFSELGIDVVLSAHDHVYVRSQMMDGDTVSDDTVIGNAVTDPEGVLYLCANSSSGSKHYTQYVEDAYFVAKENYEKRKSAVRIDITDSSFTMTTYFLDTMEILDTFTINKSVQDSEPQDPYQTPYGRIPEGTDPAIAVFDTNGSFIAGYDSWLEVVSNHISVVSDVYIYFRKSVVQDGLDHDGGKMGGTKVIDLGGKTLSSNDNKNHSALFYAPAKSNPKAKTNVTVKNGSIDVGSKYVWLTGCVRESAKNKAISVVFQDIKFKNIDNNIISDGYGASFPYENNFTFNDCTFTNATAPLFKIKNASYGSINITINGGYVNQKIDTLPTLFDIVEQKENMTVTLGVGKNGGVFELYVQKSDALPDSIALPYQKSGVSLNKNASAETATQSVYQVSEQTPYGVIDYTYFDAPIVIFNSKGNVIGRCDNLLEMFENYISVQGDVIIYLRKSLTNLTMDFNAGKAGGTKIIDLNDNTITVNTDSFYYGQAKNSNAAQVTFKNGTIDTNGKTFCVIGCDREKAKAKELEAIFESITFTNVEKALIATGASTFTFQGNFTFNNCTIEASSALETPLFLSSYPSNGTVDVKVNGGNIFLGNNSADVLKVTPDSSSYTLSYNAYEGKYTTVSFANTVNTSEFVEFTKEGTPVGLYKTAETDDATIYTISSLSIVKAYLNLTNDLNLVYRVFLPCGYQNPTATFTLCGSTVTVSEYTIDENGLYCFTLSSVGPHRMQSTVTATVSATYGDQVYTNTNDSISVKSYLDTVRKENAEDAELVALIDSLLVYGAAAQQYVGSTDAPVASIGELNPVEQTPLTLTGNGFAKIGMRLDSNIALGVKCKLDSYDGITLEVSKNGVTSVYALSDYINEDGYAAVYYDDIYASEIDKVITFTLKSGDEVIGTLEMSASSYLYLANNQQDENLVTLTRALYAYGKCASAYRA